MKTQRVSFKWFALLILSAMLLQSALLMPSAYAQAESTPTAAQEPAPTGCNAGPCPATPPQSTSAPSLQSFAASGSVTGITDPALIPNPSVYDFSADEPGSAPTSFPGGAFSGDREVFVIGSTWATWNPQTDGKHVLFAPLNTIDILFISPQAGVVVKAEPISSTGSTSRSKLLMATARPWEVSLNPFMAMLVQPSSGSFRHQTI
jgi:hypothetical protein